MVLFVLYAWHCVVHLNVHSLQRQHIYTVIVIRFSRIGEARWTYVRLELIVTEARIVSFFSFIMLTQSLVYWIQQYAIAIAY